MHRRQLGIAFSPPFFKGWLSIHNYKWASELLQWHESEAIQFDTKSIMMSHLRDSSEKQLKSKLYGSEHSGLVHFPLGLVGFTRARARKALRPDGGGRTRV